MLSSGYMYYKAGPGLTVATKVSGVVRRGAGVLSALEEPAPAASAPPAPEPLREPRAGSAARAALSCELSALCRAPPTVPLVVGGQRVARGACRPQPMPFDHARSAALVLRAAPDDVRSAVAAACAAQRTWGAAPVDERCRVFERAAALLAGEHRARVIAAAVVGQAATAIRAELDLRQLVDQIRIDCHFARDLTRSRCVLDGGPGARNRNAYHSLEGFWAAMSPSDSVASGAYPALAPALMGNGVVWRPSDEAALAAYRVLEALEAAGLPPGVVNFVPADEDEFLEAAVDDAALAGVCFGGPTAALENVWRRVGENVEKYARFPRVTGLASGGAFHVVHESADLAAAVAGTVRAAFEMAGQKPTSCSRVYVAEPAFDRFAEALERATRALVVCHPLDYRCFVSSLGSQAAWRRAAASVEEAARGDGDAALVCGGRADAAVGWFVEPTVVAVRAPGHALLTGGGRGPLLALAAVEARDAAALGGAVGASWLATSGALYARDAGWARRAVAALRHSALTLVINDRCSELLPGQQSLGGSRKSGNGAKMGSISCLLQYCDERSLREVLRPSASALTYPYMDECPLAAPRKPPAHK